MTTRKPPHVPSPRPPHIADRSTRGAARIGGKVVIGIAFLCFLTCCAVIVYGIALFATGVLR